MLHPELAGDRGATGGLHRVVNWVCAKRWLHLRWRHQLVGRLDPKRRAPHSCPASDNVLDSGKRSARYPECATQTGTPMQDRDLVSPRFIRLGSKRTTLGCHGEWWLTA